MVNIGGVDLFESLWAKWVGSWFLFLAWSIRIRFELDILARLRHLTLGKCWICAEYNPVWVLLFDYQKSSTSSYNPQFENISSGAADSVSGALLSTTRNVSVVGDCIGSFS